MEDEVFAVETIQEVGFFPSPFALFKPFLLLPQRFLNLQFNKGDELPLNRFLKGLKAGAGWHAEPVCT